MHLLPVLCLSLLLFFVLTLYPFTQVISPSLSTSPSVPPDGNMFIHYWYSDWARFPPPSPHFHAACPTSPESSRDTCTHSRCTSLCETKVVLVLIEVCVCVCVCVCVVCVCSSRWDRKRETKWASTHSEFLYLDPYKRMFPASNCASTGLSKAQQSLRHSIASSGLYSPVALFIWACVYIHVLK